jgi:putative redox protein
VNYNPAMVEITATYEGQLHCSATHGPSHATLATDAPKDNMGKGEAFSPTDLVATALGTCMLTTMGIVAQRHGIDMTGATIRVTKEMVSQPSRRIGRLPVEIAMPRELGEEDRQRLENAALTCPVAKSIAGEIQMPVTFKWGGGDGHAERKPFEKTPRPAAGEGAR